MCSHSSSTTVAGHRHDEMKTLGIGTDLTRRGCCPFLLLRLLQALAALNEYHAAISETSVTIRNKPAYLMGILRKYKQGQRAPLGNGAAGGMATSPNAMGRMGVRTRG